MKSDTQRSFTLSLESESGVTRSDSLGGTTDVLSGPVRAPASPSRSPAEVKAPTTSDTSGLSGSASSASAALREFMVSRLRQLLPTAGGMMWPMTWKQKATPLGRQYCQLAVSAGRTSGTDCGLWLTPACVMTVEAPAAMKLRAQRNGYKNGTTIGSLATQVTLWPTPCASDLKGSPSYLVAKQREAASPRGVRLEETIIRNGLPSEMGKKGKLNPAFVCWLMGYSTAHLSSMLLAMQSFRKSPRMQGNRHDNVRRNARIHDRSTQQMPQWSARQILPAGHKFC